MEGHAEQCVERCFEHAGMSASASMLVETSCVEDHPFSLNEFNSTGDLAPVWAQIVLTCVYLARIGRRDLLWTVNVMARSVTKWNKPCWEQCLWQQVGPIEKLSQPLETLQKILFFLPILRIANLD